MNKTETDSATVNRIGHILYATRKHLGVNQTTLAPQLGLDQSALSRVESGKQMLSAPQWFTFCAITGVQPDSVTRGYFSLPTALSAIRLPSRYNSERRTRVRGILPLLEHTKQALGDAAIDEILRKLKVDPDFVMNMNAQVNFNFILDLVSETALRLGSSQAAIDRTADIATRLDSQNELAPLIAAFKTQPILLMTLVVQHLTSLGSDFSYQVTASSATQIDISVQPGDHLNATELRTHEVFSKIYPSYQRTFFEQFAASVGGPTLSLVELESFFNGAARTLYRMTISA